MLLDQQSHMLPCRTLDQTCLVLNSGTSPGYWASSSVGEHHSKMEPRWEFEDTSYLLKSKQNIDSRNKNVDVY